MSRSARCWKNNEYLFSCELAVGRVGFLTLSAAFASMFPPTLPGQDLKPTPFVNGSRYQHSVCTVLDREKYSTLHTCGTKILPCEEDGVVVVLVVIGVPALLRVGPPTNLLQAAGWVATLDQAYRLQEIQRAGTKCYHSNYENK